MCNNCSKYISIGCEYCLECGSKLSTNKEASEEQEEMFKHAMDEEEVKEIVKEEKNDNKKN